MPFLVFEQDPLVRKDICEALADAFQGDTIVVAETVEGLRDMALAISAPAVAVLAIPPDVAQAALGQIDQLLTDLRVVIIGDAPDEAPKGQDYIYLSRPFSSGNLIQKVSDAIKG